MPDIIDTANDLADLHLEAAIENQRIQATRMQWSGRCYNCQEPVGNTLFCDKDCAEDFERRNKRNA